MFEFHPSFSNLERSFDPAGSEWSKQNLDCAKAIRCVLLNTTQAALLKYAIINLILSNRKDAE